MHLVSNLVDTRTEKRESRIPIWQGYVEPKKTELEGGGGLKEEDKNVGDLCVCAL